MERDVGRKQENATIEGERMLDERRKTKNGGNEIS